MRSLSPHTLHRSNTSPGYRIRPQDTKQPNSLRKPILKLILSLLLAASIAGMSESSFLLCGSAPMVLLQYMKKVVLLQDCTSIYSAPKKTLYQLSRASGQAAAPALIDHNIWLYIWTKETSEPEPSFPQKRVSRAASES